MGRAGNNVRATGGGPRRRRVVSIVGNPDGNRAERRVAAKIARMSPEKQAKLPRAQFSSAGRWFQAPQKPNGG
jgi:hypothetical protein